MIWERFRRKKEKEKNLVDKENFVKDELLELKEKISSPYFPEHEKKEKPFSYPSFPTFEIEKSYTYKTHQPKNKDIEHKIEHKLEIILSKLEIINERLKVIEEKVEKQKF